MPLSYIYIDKLLELFNGVNKVYALRHKNYKIDLPKSLYSKGVVLLFPIC
jgi:hypothetical protein